MKIEKWKYKDTEIEVPIFEENEIETNDDFNELEDTVDLTDTLENVGDNNAN